MNWQEELREIRPTYVKMAQFLQGQQVDTKCAFDLVEVILEKDASIGIGYGTNVLEAKLEAIKD